ncbi:MAG: glycosyltransferase family 9 protein [Desulfobacteraceae bacterium]|nr:MAG: glycosyltransferase family 9 protein [Desulfobacteraceae bacterium]
MKVLLIKLRYIGDTLSLLPVIESLWTQAPDIRADVMIHKGTEELLRYHPGIGKIWVYDRSAAKNNILKSIRYHSRLIRNLRAEKYDALIDYTLGDRAAFLSFLIHAPLRVSYRVSSSLSKILMNKIIDLDPQAHHIVDYQLAALKTLGLDHPAGRMKIVLPESLEKRIEQLLPSRKNCKRLRVIIHPGAARRLRQWRPDRFGLIARKLREQYGAEIILLSGGHEEPLIEEIERRMGFPALFKSARLTLLEIAGILKQGDLLIANDSAPGHMAAGVACPSLILFGPTFPHMWRPYDARNEVVFKNVPCCGCRQLSCSRPESNCMDLIEVEDVWEKIQSLLKPL